MQAFRKVSVVLLNFCSTVQSVLLRPFNNQSVRSSAAAEPNSVCQRDCAHQGLMASITANA